MTNNAFLGDKPPPPILQQMGVQMDKQPVKSKLAQNNA